MGTTLLVATFLALTESSNCDLPSKSPQNHEDVGTKHDDLAESADQPALGLDGQLLDALKITWHYDPNDPHLIQPSDPMSGIQAIAAKKLNKYGSSCHCFIKPCNAKASAKCKQPTINESHGDAIDSDTEDKTFVITVSSNNNCNNNLSDLASDDIEIGNNKNQKCCALKPKVMKMTATSTTHLKKKARKTSGTKIKVIDGEDSPYIRHSTGNAAGRSVMISPSSSF
ncbi:hypothetical protein BJV74DRAFT_794312 [Russula compacta]|nr:hypothetical protein BJV74DRAFT_794312 [Russula compacta]